jgi:hypothetical protein
MLEITNALLYQNIVLFANKIYILLGFNGYSVNFKKPRTHAMIRLKIVIPCLPAGKRQSFSRLPRWFPPVADAGESKSEKRQ